MGEYFPFFLLIIDHFPSLCTFPLENIHFSCVLYFTSAKSCLVLDSCIYWFCFLKHKSLYLATLQQNLVIFILFLTNPLCYKINFRYLYFFLLQVFFFLAVRKNVLSTTFPAFITSTGYFSSRRLCSQEMLLCIMKPIWGARDWMQIGGMQGKLPTYSILLLLWPTFLYYWR